MQDVSGGSDPVIWENVNNGDFTDYQSFRRVYIASPENASSNFTVTIFAVTSAS
ncbi:hypothetical protein [Candidatus Entotheonella palauensis]|uniref:hypothetical protein n=1 Tax=Candidatus Entotheonella palauensis TaxID=93172 RepID=UPI0015C4312A|nr:hypothetical protein [Candidatus Entotheonella palauensis]